MKWFAILGLFISVQSPGQDARSIIEKANEKIKALQSISLNVTINDKYTGQVGADVIISREKQYAVFGISKVKMSGIAITPGGSVNLSMVFDGKTFTYLDVKKNELVLVSEPTYMKIGRTGMLMYADAIPAVYYEDYAWDTLLSRAVKFEMRKDTVIFNQQAYAVDVEQKIYNKFTGGHFTSTITLYIDKNSYLPLGRFSSGGSSAHYKIRSVNDVYLTEDFALPGYNTIKQEDQPVKAIVYLDLNSQAPDWTLPSNKNVPITLNKLKGKVVLLDFWGTWCAPCLKSMPAVQSIYDHFKNKQVEVIGVSVEPEGGIDVPAFINKKGFTYPIALDGNTIVKDYKLSQYPTIYIIDKKGKIVFAGEGRDLEQQKKSIIQIIQKALIAN